MLQQARLRLQVGQQRRALGGDGAPHRLQGVGLQAVQVQRFPHDRLPAAPGVQALPEPRLAVQGHGGQILHAAPRLLQMAERSAAHRAVGILQPVHELPHRQLHLLPVLGHRGAQRAGQLVVHPPPGVVAVDRQRLGQRLPPRVHLVARHGALPVQEERDRGQRLLLQQAPPGVVGQRQQALVDFHFDALQPRFDRVQPAAELGGHRVAGIGRRQALHEAVRLAQLGRALLPAAHRRAPVARLLAERRHLPGERLDARVQAGQKIGELRRPRAAGEDHLQIPGLLQFQSHAPFWSRKDAQDGPWPIERHSGRSVTYAAALPINDST